jgi:K+-transporting ATPase A subunit
MDAPFLFWVALLSLFPLQLFPGGMALGGHGVITASCQGIAILGLFIAAILVWRSPKQSSWVKIVVLPVGYPVVILLTNLIPVLVSRMTGSFYQP